jgi:AAA domain
MEEEPVVILTGPRTVGKSTMLSELGAEFDRTVFDLDRLDVRAAAVADPGFLISGPEPVLIDEFQHAPEILDAIKAELNQDTRPGRFVLTDSTRYTVLPQAAQSLTGWAPVVNVLPRHRAHPAARSAAQAVAPVRGADRSAAQHHEGRTGHRAGKQYREPVRDPPGSGIHDPAAASLGRDTRQAALRPPEGARHRLRAGGLAARAQRREDQLNGLRLLRDRLGDRFVAGFVLNLGELAYRKEDKIAVMPLSALWSLPGTSQMHPPRSTDCPSRWKYFSPSG